MKKLGSFLLIFLAFLVWVHAARAATVTGVEITGFGLFKREVIRKVPAPGTAIGTLNIVKTHLVETTDRVPARIGITFGYEYRLLGSPNGAKVTLTFKTMYPGLKRPGKEGILREGIYMRTKIIGVKNAASYTFEKDWEVVPGRWTFQIFHRGRKLMEKSFTVYKP